MLGKVAGIPASVMSLREFRHWGTVIGDGLVSRLQVAGGDQIQTHALQTTLLKLQRLGSTVRQVDNPTRNDGPAVIDPDHDGPAIAQVCDPHIASHGKGQVSGGHVVHIVRLAAGRGFSVENLAVPGRCPNLIRFGLADLLADFGSRLNGTNWSRCRLRDVRSLSRSQADDQEGNRQSISYTSSHSVLLAYSKVLGLKAYFLQFVDAIGVPNACQGDLGGAWVTSLLWMSYVTYC